MSPGTIGLPTLTYEISRTSGNPHSIDLARDERTSGVVLKKVVSFFEVY